MSFPEIRRMRRPYLFLLCVLFGVNFVGTTTSYASDSLRILTVNEPPSNYIDSTGQVVGFTIDVVKEIQRRIGDTTPIEVLPERRLLSMAETGKHIIVGISRTPGREHRYRWIAKLLIKPWILYSYRENNSDIKTLDQAKDVRVGVVHGDVREEYVWENGFKHVDASNSHFSNLKKLKEGRIDLAFWEPQGVAYVCAVNNFEASDYRPILQPFVSEVYVAMPKDADLSIFRIWEKTAQEMKRDGTFFRIAEKWSKYLSEKFGISSVPSGDALAFTQ